MNSGHSETAGRVRELGEINLPESLVDDLTGGRPEAGATLAGLSALIWKLHRDNAKLRARLSRR